MRPARLVRRAEFLRCASSGRKAALPGMVVQALRRGPDDAAPARVGFTVTRKVGKSVVRNRVRRRLREVARLHFGQVGAPPGHDLVLIGREATIRRDFAALRQDFERAVARLVTGGAP